MVIFELAGRDIDLASYPSSPADSSAWLRESVDFNAEPGLDRRQGELLCFKAVSRESRVDSLAERCSQMLVLRGGVCAVGIVLGACLAGCGGSGLNDRAAKRSAAEAAELQEMKEEVSPDELKKIAAFDGEEQVPDRIVLRRLQQRKARSGTSAQ